MFWSLSFQLLQGEEIITDSAKQAIKGFKPTYSVYLTNKRVIFLFEGIKSTLTQSFTYAEITDATLARRLLINYLCLHIADRKFFLHTTAPSYWATTILNMKNNLLASQAEQLSKERMNEGKLRELNHMLAELRHYDILSDDEVEVKKKKIGALRSDAGP